MPPVARPLEVPARQKTLLGLPPPPVPDDSSTETPMPLGDHRAPPPVAAKSAPVAPAPPAPPSSPVASPLQGLFSADEPTAPLPSAPGGPKLDSGIGALFNLDSGLPPPAARKTPPPPPAPSSPLGPPPFHLSSGMPGPQPLGSSRVPPPPTGAARTGAPPPPPAPPGAARTPAPPPPPTKSQVPSPAKAGGHVDIDWDDDDEKTAIFDRHSSDEAPFPGGSRSVPPTTRSDPHASAHPPPPPPFLGGHAEPRPASQPSKAPTLVSRRPPAPAISPASAMPPPAPAPVRSNAGLMVIVGGLALLLIAAIVVLLIPRTGTLIVTVAGPGSKRVDAVEVRVDDKKVCDRSPCRVDLSAETHMVRVSAAGYQDTADKPAVIEGGKEYVLDLELAPISDGTGLRVSAEGTGLKLWVDDKEVGPLPQDVKDLTPGEHTIRVAGNDRYEPVEQKVTVKANEMTPVGPVQPKVIKGLAIIEAGSNADGAKVRIVSGDKTRPIPSLPINVDIKTDKSYTLVAAKSGFKTYERPLEFEPGKAEKTFTIDLIPESSADEPAPEPRRGGGARPVAPRPATPAPRPAPAVAAGTQGTLNINSIPVSNVVLDGVPRGSTPKIGLKVAPGKHTVVFIHPQHGRKVTSVNVQPGQTATAAVRFP